MNNKFDIAGLVQPGWIVDFKDGSFGFIVSVTQNPLKVCVRRRSPDGIGWMTHWFSEKTWRKRFAKKYGETGICPRCGWLPCGSVDVNPDAYSVLLECDSCLHTWVEHLNYDPSVGESE